MGEHGDAIQGSGTVQQNGFTDLVPQGQYMFSRMAEKGGYTPGDDFIGDIRIKWEFVPNLKVNILAQQVKDKETDKWTFRPWNPNDIEAEVGDEEDVTEARCPVACICCFLVEKCFKTVFAEHVDDLRYE
jgi:hypothetical protein